MFKGIVFSIIAGFMVSLQGLFNTRASEKMGSLNTTAYVHASGMIIAFILVLLFEKNSFSNITQVKPLYLLGGVMGVVIIWTVTKAIGIIGISYTITIIVVLQIVISFIVNKFGLFGENQIIISQSKIGGLALMIVGLIIYQLR